MPITTVYEPGTTNKYTKYNSGIRIAIKKSKTLLKNADLLLNQGQLIYDQDINILRIGNGVNKLKDLPIFCAPQEDEPSDGKILVREKGKWHLIEE